MIVYTIYMWIVYDCLYYIYMDCIWLYRIGLGSVDIREESGENKNVLRNVSSWGKKVFSFCSWNTGSLFFARPSSTRSRFFRGHCEGQIRWVLLSFHLPHKGLQVYHGLSRSYVSSSTPSALLVSFLANTSWPACSPGSATQPSSIMSKGMSEYMPDMIW
jgi:hypothetical protein